MPSDTKTDFLKKARRKLKGLQNAVQELTAPYCPKCGVTFESHEDLRRHREKIHD